MTTQSTPLTPLFEQEQDAIRCPYASYAELRDTAPVFHDPLHDVYVVTRHADIERVTTQPQLFSNQNPMGPTVIEAMGNLPRVLKDLPPDVVELAFVALSKGQVLLTQDPPEHTRHRRILNRALTPRAVARIEPDVRAACNSLIDDFIDDGQVDLVPAYCTPAPIHALATLMGVPVERSKDFHRWAKALNAAIGATMTDEALLANVYEQIEFWEFCEAELADRAKNPKDDLFTAIAKATKEDEAPLTLNQTIGLCVQLIGAGSDTTTKHMTNFALMLCRDKSLQDHLRRSYGDLPAYLEETLRVESPVQGTFRVATEDTELGGVKIPKGAYVWVVWASGNRDERVFDQPEIYNPLRTRVRPHQAFGHGPHTCLGSPLARSVSRIAFEVLFDRLDDLELQDPDFVPVYDRSYVFHGISSLPVKFRAATH
ncbi:cytochrome P450 [Mycobacterium sp. E1747]|uniref:cytochrome P450 n=1 Tax=Mycobacterium sp. E1747 TaxID=1834128 RepID=UPI0008000337|nr:cytochrome P450 [Mycobacterium sp. E1747]OBH10423.1 hypothetical protein A5695_22155 [Mycobacterium sp. E1747]